MNIASWKELTLDPITLTLVAIGGLFALVAIGRFKPTKIPVKSGEALIRYRALRSETEAGPRVSFEPLYVINSLDTWEVIDISPKTCTYEVSGYLSDGSDCTLEVQFVLAVPARPESVLSAAGCLGVERASSPDAVRDFFHYPLVEAVETVLGLITPKLLQNKNENEKVCVALSDSQPWSLIDSGYEIFSVEIRKVRCHKRGKSWTR